MDDDVHRHARDRAKRTRRGRQRAQRIVDVVGGESDCPEAMVRHLRALPNLYVRVFAMAVTA